MNADKNSLTEKNVDQGDAGATKDEPSDRPLVTFALFAYNQERYIREAVEGAFAQTYEPMEIILSDDCSSDMTFEIMRELTEAYRGPHKVQLNKTTHNNGILSHMLKVARKSSGALMVVAAGDDISYPQRTERLYSEWAKIRPACLYSAYDEIDANSKYRTKNIHPCQDQNAIWKYFLHQPQREFCLGFGAAYSATFLSKLPDVDLVIHHEDWVMTLLAHATNSKILCLPDTLVKYRVHQSYVNAKFSNENISGIIAQAQRIASYAESHHNLILYVKDALDCLESNRTLNLLDMEAINSSQRMNYFEWKSLRGSFCERCKLLFEIKTYSELRMVLIRIFGLRMYATIKLLVNYFSKFLLRTSRIDGAR